MKRITRLAIFEAAFALMAFSLVAQEKVNHWDISKVDVSKLPPAATQPGVTFDKDIKPLLDASCVGCHGKMKPRAGLRLDNLEGVLKGGRDGKMVVPGDSAKSLLVAAAARIDDHIAMPPKHRPRPGGPGGPEGAGGPPPGAPPPGSTPDAGPPPGTPPPGGPAPQAGGGPGGPGGPHKPSKPLTEDQVALLRAWVDQGAN
ncbi:MAG TPA: c-type cytochrome domain-containing protein [Verrucomicrobiae bacterium]|nr:c-type cytochrome domain-containing protein [Verrucomicrobiae bacterium]